MALLRIEIITDLHKLIIVIGKSIFYRDIKIRKVHMGHKIQFPGSLATDQPQHPKGMTICFLIGYFSEHDSIQSFTKMFFCSEK